MKLLVFLLLLSLIQVLDVQAQKDTAKIKKKSIDTRYIEKYSEYPAVHLSLFYRYNNIGIFDTTGRTLKYMPNVKFNFGPGFACKYFAIEMSFITFGNLDEKKYGKTTKLDIQSHIYLKRFITDFVYQDYKGFYLDSLMRKVKDTIINTHHTYLKPDMEQQSIGGSIMYFTNFRKYSFKSTFSQTEFQKKSAGTWAFGLSFHYLTLNSETGLVHDSVKQYIDSAAYFKSITSINAGIIGGYFHTFTLKRWYTTISMMIGLEGKTGSYTLEDDIVKKDTNYASFRMQIRFGTGYNTKHFYFGMSVIGDGYLFNNSLQQYGTIRLFIGYRFVPKK
jgi:hypothetical protein